MPRTLPIVAAAAEPQPYLAEHPSAFPVYRWRLRWRDEIRAELRADDVRLDAPDDDRPAWPAPTSSRPS